jgi:hypothetical protein
VWSSSITFLAWLAFIVAQGVSSEGGLYFGAGKDLDAASFFSGLIDDIRIYSVALTAEEIEELAR